MELTELEREEREWKRGIDRENWELCMQAYSGTATWHINHSHNTPTTPSSEAAYIRSDLAVNRCQIILRDHWIDY